MAIDEAFVQELISQWECDWIDFKLEHHGNRAELIHDVLCLANADRRGDRFLVFGVRNNRDVAGIETAQRAVQSNIINLLVSARFNHTPSIRLVDVTFTSGAVVQVLVVRDLPEKPYFLLEDYSFRDRRVRAGVPYTRVEDTNTPLNRCPDDIKVAKMYRERFSLDKPPAERLKTYLRDTGSWRRAYAGARSLYLCYDPFPEFVLEEDSSESEGFYEPWIKHFPDRVGHKREYVLRYHTTILASLLAVSCDGGRVVLALPSTQSFDVESDQPYRAYYYVRDSFEYLVNAILSDTLTTDRRDTPALEIPVFESEDDARLKLRADYEAGQVGYSYYYRDQSTGRDWVVKGESRRDLG